MIGAPRLRVPILIAERRLSSPAKEYRRWSSSRGFDETCPGAQLNLLFSLDAQERRFLHFGMLTQEAVRGYSVSRSADDERDLWPDGTRLLFQTTLAWASAAGKAL